MSLDVGVLYRDHATKVWRYVRARVPSDADAEDVTSEVFARAMSSQHRFDPARGSRRAWILGIARNTTADWWRRQRPEDMSSDAVDGVAGETSLSDDPAERVVVADEATALHRYLSRLTDREREAVALRFGAELSSADIGAVMGISPTAARMLVHRGVTKLREVIVDG